MAVSFRRSSLWLTILFPQSQTSLSEVISLCDVKLQKANYQYPVISVTERWNSTFENSNWKQILALRNGRDYTGRHTGKPNLNFQPNQLSQYIPELFRANATNDIPLRVKPNVPPTDSDKRAADFPQAVLPIHERVS